MNLWEELDACKFEDNEYLVDHLIEVVKDEELNTFEELEKYQEDYFKESGMTKEDWIKWYEKSFDKIPDLENIYGEAAANKINALRKELTSTKDTNKKIENIIKICVILEKECCFLVEIYNLIMGGEVTEEVTTEENSTIPSNTTVYNGDGIGNLTLSNSSSNLLNNEDLVSSNSFEGIIIPLL